MVAFKLLLLPLIAFECVLKRMDGLDLIGFAVISRRTRRSAKSIKKKMHSIDATFGIRFFEQIETQIFEDRDRCKENEEDFEERTDRNEKEEEEYRKSYVFKFCDHRAGENNGLPHWTFILDKMTFVMTKTLVAQKTTCIFYSWNRIAAATKFVELLYQTFKPNDFDLTLEDSLRTEFKNYVRWNLLKEVQNLGFHVSFKVTDEQFELFHDTVRHVPRQSLSFTFPEHTNKDHGITATFDDDVLCIIEAAWFKKTDFDLLNVRVFYSRQSDLVNEDIRYMLHKWMTTVSWKLEKAEIEMEEPELNVILGGLEVMSTAQLKKRVPQLKEKELKFDHGELVFLQDKAKHLLRMDSTIATIQLNVEQNTLCFSVWTNINPLIQ